MQAYKALHPDKAQGAIFGPEANGEKSGGKKDLDAMKIDEIQKKERKSLRYCQICTGKGFKNKAKLHNTVNCYDKPGNEDKRPQKSSSQKPFPLGPSKNKNQSFRARLMKLLEEESDDPESPPEAVNINSTSIEEIPNPVPPSRKGKGTPKLDFPLGLQSITSVIYSQRIVYPQLAHKSWKQYWNLVNNIACNKTISFKIPVTLWIYSKKVQTEALVDLGATTNFINRVIVENNNLVTHKLVNPYHVINTDGTPNKAGQITEYV